jgi:hypothetical protein
MQSERFYFYTILTIATGLGLIFSACAPSNPQPASAAPSEPASRGYWVDPDTHFMWAAKDSGYEITWERAVKYCKNLKTGGFRDWTLPTKEQLATVDSPEENDFGHPIKGNIKLTTSYEWSDRSDVLWDFFRGEQTTPYYGYDKRALCVRRTGD